MKRISLTFVSVVLTCMCQMVFSQNPVIKRSALRGTGQFDITMNSKNTGESLKTHLKIPKDYELRNRIVSSITNQTKEKDELGYVHERYAQYYKGIRIEHSDIRTQYLNDKLVGVNGEYIDVPDIDISVVISKEAAIQKAIEHIGAKKYIWEDEQECESQKAHKTQMGDFQTDLFLSKK